MYRSSGVPLGGDRVSRMLPVVVYRRMKPAHALAHLPPTLEIWFQRSSLIVDKGAVRTTRRLMFGVVESVPCVSSSDDADFSRATDGFLYEGTNKLSLSTIQLRVQIERGLRDMSPAVSTSTSSSSTFLALSSPNMAGLLRSKPSQIQLLGMATPRCKPRLLLFANRSNERFVLPGVYYRPGGIHIAVALAFRLQEHASGYLSAAAN
eukprot:450648-Pleurochrysis_carterae.AAC.2